MSRRIAISCTPSQYTSIGHAAVDEDLSRSGYCLRAAQLYLSLQEVLPRARAEAKRRGVGLGDFLADLVLRNTGPLRD